MSLNELYEMLDLDPSGKLEYFEQLADLLECEEEISEKAFFTVISHADSSIISELTENYFDELLKALPESETDLYSLLDTVKTKLMGYAEAFEDDSENYASELYRFRSWYLDDEKCRVGGKNCCVRDAAFGIRADKLINEEQEYDFSGALDYPLDEIVMNLGAFEPIRMDSDRHLS